LSEPIPPLADLQEKNEKSFVDDFNRDWYTEIGAKILTTLIISIATPHLVTLAMLPITKWQMS